MNRGFAQINVYCGACVSNTNHRYHYVEFWMYSERIYYKYECTLCGYTIQDKSAVERVEKYSTELLQRW